MANQQQNPWPANDLSAASQPASNKPGSSQQQSASKPEATSQSTKLNFEFVTPQWTRIPNFVSSVLEADSQFVFLRTGL